MTRLLVIRHAESVWNAERRWQGRADPPLSEAGRNDARRAAETVRGEIELAAASPQQRARHTAEIIAGVLGLGAVETDDDLREIDAGEFTGLTIEEVHERFGPELEAYRAGTADSAPGGESRTAMLERVLRALRHIASSHEGSNVLVVTHGGALGSLERHFGCHPGTGTGNLSGRWFSIDGEIRPASERVHLVRDEHESAPEAR